MPTGIAKFTKEKLEWFINLGQIEYLKLSIDLNEKM